MTGPRESSRSEGWSVARTSGGVLVRALVCLVVAGVLGAPLALSWALTHTEVVSPIGTSPTTFSLSTGGISEVRRGIAGTVFVPESRGAVGIVATVIGPGDPGAGDVGGRWCRPGERSPWCHERAQLPSAPR